MKLWLITRTDETNWDEFNAVLVRAGSKQAAIALALSPTEAWPGSTVSTKPYGFSEDNLVVTEVSPDGPEEVIIVDFLRG